MKLEKSIFLLSCENNYKLVKFDSEVSMCNDNVMKTEPSNDNTMVKTEHQINILYSANSNHFHHC